MLRRNKSDSGEIGLLHRWRCNGVVSRAAESRRFSHLLEHNIATIIKEEM